MEIVRLGVSQGSRLRSIRLRALRDAPDAFGSTFEGSEARPPEAWVQQLRDLATFVAVVDGRDVGIVRGDAETEDETRVWLISMWVAPEARGHGVGEALVDEVIGWARSTPATVLLLEVGDDNAPAIALYERMGFVPNGVVGSLPPPRDHIGEHQRALYL